MSDVATHDHAAAYEELRTRVTGLVRAHLDELDDIAPATPEWRVRDIVAHLAGVTDDIANGRLDGVGTNAWTAKQVEVRRDAPIEEVLSDWQAHTATIRPLFPNFPAVALGQMLMDAYTHEQDLRGALKSPGGRTGPALDIAFEWIADRLGERLANDGAGTLVLETEAGTKTIGSGEPTTTIRADRFELARAITGRRSRAQLDAIERDGPFDPQELLFSSEIFSPAPNDLVE